MIPTCSDVVEARHIQALIFLLSHRLGTSRHFSANSLVISDHIRLLNPTDCFGSECFALDANNRLYYRSFPNFQFLSLIKYFLLGCISHLQRLYITNVFSEEEPRFFLIYRYITAYMKSNHITCYLQLNMVCSTPYYLLNAHSVPHIYISLISLQRT